MGVSGNPEGREKIPINWDTVDNMLKIHCTGEEVAAFLDISYDTIERRCKDEKKKSFADYSKLKRGAGKPSLRRSQWIAATEDRNPTMLIWLGKNYLDQKDVVRNEHTGKDGGPIQSITAEMSHEEATKLYQDMIDGD